MIPTDYHITFFSLKKATSFSTWLINSGCTNVYISSERDAFGQTQYLVYWDKEET